MHDARFSYCRALISEMRLIFPIMRVDTDNSTEYPQQRNLRRTYRLKTRRQTISCETFLSNNNNKNNLVGWATIGALRSYLTNVSVHVSSGTMNGTARTNENTLIAEIAIIYGANETCNTHYTRFIWCPEHVSCEGLDAQETRLNLDCRFHSIEFGGSAVSLYHDL